MAAIKWVSSAYVDSIMIDNLEGGIRFKQFIKTFSLLKTNLERPIQACGIGRVFNHFWQLKYYIPIVDGAYTCTVFTILIDDITVNYAYLYWKKDSGSFEPEFICIAPSFDSRDGEYRTQFMRWAAFNAAYESIITEMAPIEKLVLQLIGNGQIELKSTGYPEREIDSRLPIITLCIAIGMDGSDFIHNIRMSHINLKYVQMLDSIMKKTPIELSSFHFQHKAFYRQFISPFTALKCCGQKITPMYLREVMQPFDFNLSTWRELALTQDVSDLIINFISPSFAMYNKYMFLEDTDPGIFDNDAMHSRYARGISALTSTKSLRDARKHLDSTDYMSGELQSHIYENIMFAQSFLLMSPVSLVQLIEDVGITMQSLPHIVKFLDAKRFDLTGLDSFSNDIDGPHYIFDLVYAAHCLHTKTSLAHTDLHGNNMTLYHWGNLYAASEIDPQYTDSAIMYIAGPRGEADTYVFLVTGISACIIDYSRAIIGPGYRPKLEKAFSPQYATNFYRDQVNRVLRAFHRYAPEYVAKHQDVIKATIIANFESAFPVLCAVDFIAIGATLTAVYTNAEVPEPGELRPIKIHPKLFELAGQVEKMGRELLSTGLQHIVAGRLDKIEFPGQKLITKLFEYWSFPKWIAREPSHGRNVHLADIYNYNNPIKYSGQSYEAFPSWAKLETHESHPDEPNITKDLKKYKLYDAFLESRFPTDQIDIIAAEVLAQQEKLDGKPVSTTSSWIHE